MPTETFFETRQAPNGNPPPIPFAIGTISGDIPEDSKAKKFLFGNKESIKECVLVSLKTKSVTAILMLGSEANEKYSAEKDSLFLEFISDVASSLIDRHNN